MDISGIITSILTMTEALLPAITSSSNVSMIDSVISALIEMLPFIAQEIAALYTPVKNIIAALSANPATTAQQLASLQQLDMTVDAAFDQIASQTDAGN